jgi:hypothetical protein
VEPKQRATKGKGMTTTLLFNPSQASTEELEKTFVGRHELLKRLEVDMLADLQSNTPRHWQIIGPRGSGKTYLTELLARRMRNSGWRVARLPEENYNIGSLGELLEQIYSRSENVTTSPLATSPDEIQVQDRALDLLRNARIESRKPLLVIIENLGVLLERQLRAPKQQGRLRDILTNNPPFILVATSTSQSDATLNHSAPLYDFFHTLVLDDLTQEDITSLVHARATWEGNTSVIDDFKRIKGRIQAIYHLSGGNPRLALALYRIVQHGVTAELHDQILKLLDEVTPYYQARINDVPAQAARVLVEMAISETVITPAELARRTRIPTNQVTAQIRKLMDERLIVQGGRPDARSRLYELRDRLLRIWLQMRESAGAAKRLRFIGEFFSRWYADRSEELEEVSRKTITDFWSDLATGNERRCTDRLKTLSYLAEIGPHFDDSIVAKTIATHVGNSSQSDVRSHVDSLQRTFSRTSDSREREALAFLLSTCYSVLDTEKEGIPFLRSAIDEGSHSEAIAKGYAAALVDAHEYAAAWSFGARWLEEHPRHRLLLGPAGVAAFGTGRIEEGLTLLRQYVDRQGCPHCAEEVLRRAINALRTQEVSSDTEVRFWKQLIGPDGAEPTVEQVGATLFILKESQLAKISVGRFLTAIKAWPDPSKAPFWLVHKAICALSHRRSRAKDALKFIVALAQSGGELLSPFAVDHLVEILPELRKTKDSSSSAMALYFSAMELVRKHTTPDALARAFRFRAPHIVKRVPSGATELLDLYREWQEQGRLKEPITPYSEILSVLASETPALTLQSFHPEVRDAVNLVLRALRKSPVNNEKKESAQALVN